MNRFFENIMQNENQKTVEDGNEVTKNKFFFANERFSVTLPAHVASGEPVATPEVFLGRGPVGRWN